MLEALLETFIVQDESLANTFKSTILSMYNLNADMKFFCGALPCSLMRQDLKYLEEMEYIISEKTDGVRFLLLLTRSVSGANVDKMGNTELAREYSILVDRGFRFYYTNLKFDDSLRDGEGTLLDGEIVYEATGYKFFIHDIVCLRGKRYIASRSYRERMDTVRKILRWSCFPPDPRDGDIVPPETQPFCHPRGEFLMVLAKQIYPLSHLEQLYRGIIPKLAHRNDGVILTPNNAPHVGKKNKTLFKYKNPEDHTIDLKLSKRLDISVGQYESHTDPDKADMDILNDGYGPPHFAYQLQTWDTKVDLDFCEVSMSPERWRSIGVENPDEQQGIILECKYYAPRTMWVPIGWRKDKLVPNDVYTVERTMKTMIEGLTMEELLNIARKTRTTRSRVGGFT